VVIFLSLLVLGTHGLVGRPPIASSTLLSSTRLHVATTTIAPLTSSTDVVAPSTPTQQQQQEDGATNTNTVRGISSRTALSHENEQPLINNDQLDTSSSIEFPPPLSTLDRMKRAATFWSTTIPIVANYYGLIGNIKLQELLGNKMTEEDIEVSEA
jgi:hypothetical protein